MMKVLRTVWLIARRDYRERVRTRAFLFSTAVLVLLTVGGVIAANVGKDFFNGTKTHTIGLVDPPPHLESALTAVGPAFDMHLNPEAFPNRQAADDALAAGRVDAVLVGGNEVRFKDSKNTDLVNAVSQASRSAQAVDELKKAGVSDAAITRLLSPPPLNVTYMDEGGGSSKGNTGAAFIMAIVLFGALMTYNQWILMGVVEEKSTRIVEVLLAVIRPWQLLTGKLMGVLAVAGAQMVITGIAFIATLVIAGHISIPQVSPAELILALVWFVLGLLFYSVAFAAVGATVSRQEDASTAAAPLSMVLMAAYFVSIFFVTNDANSMAARVLTFIPPFAPLIVPVRFALGGVAAWEMGVSMGLMVIAILAVSWLGGRLYTGAVLHTGPRLGLRDTWRTIRAAGPRGSNV